MHTHGRLILTDFHAIYVVKDVFVPKVKQRLVHLRANTPLNLFNQIALLTLVQNFHRTRIEIGLDLRLWDGD